MSLVKTSVLNGMAVAVRVVSSLIMNKILAMYVGPGGYAVIGQFQNVVSVISNLAGGLLASGVTKITAQHYDDEAKQYAVWRTAIRYSLVASTIAGVMLILFSRQLSDWLLHGSNMPGVFVWLAVSLPALILNNLLLSVINGKKEIWIYVISNIVGSLLGLSITGLLVPSYGLYGALIAFTINPAITLLVTSALIRRCNWCHVANFLGAIDKTAVKELTAFGIMGLVSALAGPTVFILIRDHLTHGLGLTAAGYWQATTKVSDIYLMLVISILSVYYLPRVAEIRSADELRIEIIKVYSVVMPIAVVSAAVIFLLRDSIILILFTPDFIAMSELMSWQLLGDTLKIGSWILSFVLAGRAMVKPFIITEVIFSASYFFLTLLLTPYWGLKGVVMAYTINYGFYWLCMGCLIKNELNRMRLSSK
jgi:PST family polysaccharide transporter